jgi:hypothetical protein
MTVRLELDPFADPELEHVHVGMQLMEKSQPLRLLRSFSSSSLSLSMSTFTTQFQTGECALTR